MDAREEILAIAVRCGSIKTSNLLPLLSKKVTRQYASGILHKLVKEGKLVKIGATKSAFYVLPRDRERFGAGVKKRLINKNVKEHEVLAAVAGDLPHLSRAKENVRSIFEYAFSEMLNNAIEHSGSRFIEVEARTQDGAFVFVVNDFGVGAFRSVMKKKRLGSELEAIQDILKGKTTTSPQAHSGEGIFFTSKVGDIFILESFGYRLRVDNLIRDVFIEELHPSKRGTKVTFSLSPIPSGALMTPSKHIRAIRRNMRLIRQR